MMKPWLVWLSGLCVGLQTKGLPVWFPVRAYAWVAGQVPSRVYEMKPYKVQDQITTLVNLKNIQKRFNACPSRINSKNWRQKMLSNLLYETNISLILQPDKDITKHKLQANISDQHSVELLTKY